MTAPAMTLADAARAMTPPIPRRELARRLAGVPPVGTVYGRRGRRAKTFPVAEIFKAHAGWLRERTGAQGLADLDPACQNSAGEHSARGHR